MWRRLTIWKELSSTRFRTAGSIVISTQSRRFQQLAESHSIARRHRNWNGDINVRPMGVMSKFSMSTLASIGAVAMSVSESFVDEDDELFPSSRVKLTLGVLSANAGVHAAFSLSCILRTRWKPASQLYQFMHNNFILSVERLGPRRWHLLLTHCFTHLDKRHLLQNCLLSAFAFISEPPCVTIPLFVSGAVFSATIALFMLKRIGKETTGIVGGSSGLYATISYSILNKDWKQVPSLLPHALLIGELCRSAYYAVNAWKGIGSPTFAISQCGHFSGLMLGVSVYCFSELCSSASTKGISLFESGKKHVENDKA